MKRFRARAGFTLMEVVVAAVILAILAAVTTPYFIEFLDKQRAQTTADKLSALASGIASFASAVKTTTNVATSSTYPGKISELANVIAAASTVTHNSCGSAATGTFNVTAVTSWNSFGPFVTFMVTTTGLVTPIGTIADSLVRTPNSATVGTLALRMPQIDAGDAADLDQIVDGGDGLSAGVVRWTSPSGGLTDLTYLLPVGPRC